MHELTRLGLSEAEAIIYTTVVRLGECTVKDIAKDCGYHRTNIYDVLEQLKEKGLISHHQVRKTAVYSASDPQNLYALLEEKKEALDSIVPHLLESFHASSNPVSVEVYKGEEGMKTAFRDILRIGKPLYMFGVKGQLREKLPSFAPQWLRDAKKTKLKVYGIYTVRNAPPHFTEIRYLSEELSGPVATFIYGDTIMINIWEPTLVAILIRSKFVAQMYKKHFDLLWNIAKK